MSIKIAYCIPALYWASGMERVLTLKANYFVENMGYEIYIITTDGTDKKPFYPLSSEIHLINLNINYDQLHGKSLWKRVYLYLYKQQLFKKRLSQCLMHIKPDITISTLRREINFISSIKDGSLKIGEIHFSRANYRDFKKESIPVFLRKILGKLWINQLIAKLRQLDCFVVLSYEDKEKWIELNKSNIKVIHNPLSFNPEKASECEAKKVIAVGRYTYQKGFDLLIDAWHIVNKRYPDWELHIFGEGNRAPYLGQVNALGLQSVCFLHPSCPGIEDKYLESSIFAFSSRYEGFGMVLTEAMACGIPPVSFDCPCGPKDIIHDGQNGLLVECGNIEMFAEKICYLIENEDIRKKLGRKARESTKRFGIDGIMFKWKELFEKLLNDKKSNGTSANIIAPV
ncbi:MAG: glycosyltransferase family 4 protein [Porphyromonadaceae bacterium]|nr:glycosyltransferase family 4 protein [Porphyromonadaceae bacterium]